MKRKKAPWNFGGPYRQSAKPLQPVPHSWESDFRKPPPPFSVDDVIEAVHSLAAKKGLRKIHAVLLSPRNYHEILLCMSKREYWVFPSESIFTEDTKLPSVTSRQYPRMYKTAVFTGVGKVEVRSDVNISDGKIVVVE